MLKAFRYAETVYGYDSEIKINCILNVVDDDLLSEHLVFPFAYLTEPMTALK